MRARALCLWSWHRHWPEDDTIPKFHQADRWLWSWNATIVLHMLNHARDIDQMLLCQYCRHWRAEQLFKKRERSIIFRQFYLSKKPYFLPSNSSKCPERMAANPAAPAPSTTTENQHHKYNFFISELVERLQSKRTFFLFNQTQNSQCNPFFFDYNHFIDQWKCRYVCIVTDHWYCQTVGQRWSNGCLSWLRTF